MIEKLNMRGARANAGLTQKDIAKQMGVSISTVHMWEKGKVKPKPPQMLMFAMLCGCNTDDIIFFKPSVEEN